MKIKKISLKNTSEKLSDVEMKQVLGGGNYFCIDIGIGYGMPGNGGWAYGSSAEEAGHNANMAQCRAYFLSGDSCPHFYACF